MKPDTKEQTLPAEPQGEPVTYKDPEVVEIMVTLAQIYALDDAIYNQEQLRRPETFIQPVRELRNRVAGRLTEITSKGKTPPQ